MGQAQKRKLAGVEDIVRTIDLSGIDRFLLTKWATAVPTKGDARERADLLDQLEAGDQAWSWDETLVKAAKFPIEDWHTPWALTFSKATLRYACDLIDRLDKMDAVDGGAMRILSKLEQRIRGELSLPARVPEPVPETTMEEPA